jgi:hypothetical protein
MGTGYNFHDDKTVGMKLTTHFCLVLRSRKCGAIPPPPHTHTLMTWCLIKHRDNFAFYCYHIQKICKTYLIRINYKIHFILLLWFLGSFAVIR